MEIFLWCIVGYFAIGVLVAWMAKDDVMVFHWPFVFIWPGIVAIFVFIWILHLLGFRIH